MPVAGSSRAEKRARRGERFTAVMAAIVARLPFGLARVIAPNMLGFAVISTVTFSLSLVLLIAFHGVLGWPVPVSITLAYLAGSGSSEFPRRRIPTLKILICGRTSRSPASFMIWVQDPHMGMYGKIREADVRAAAGQRRAHRHASARRP